MPSVLLLLLLLLLLLYHYTESEIKEGKSRMSMIPNNSARRPRDLREKRIPLGLIPGGRVEG